MVKTGVTKPWARVVILLFSLVTIAIVARFSTGEFLPSDPAAALIFQNALLLVVLGSALIEHKFTEPADSVVNSLMAFITLLGAHPSNAGLLWWLIVTYCLVTFGVSLSCVTVSSGPEVTGWKRTIANVTYRPATVLGKARIIFSVVFLFSVFSYYGIRDTRSATLMLFWGIFISLWPLRIPELLSMLSSNEKQRNAIGRIVRTDAPNLVRVLLEADTQWEGKMRICKLADGQHKQIIPLYRQTQNEQILGTGILVNLDEEVREIFAPGYVYEPKISISVSDSDIAERLGGDAGSKLIGFVIEDSTIASLKIETWRSDICREGVLTWCKIGDDKVFYQITDGTDKEESLETDRHGYQVAELSQLGILDATIGFKKFTWLPPMNTPVFSEGLDFGGDIETLNDDDFAFGTIPKSKLRVGGKFSEFWDHHTAIIGTTGSGKTELAFDLIRYSLENDIKVICIDLTDQYRNRLNDLGIIDLSISPDVASELGTKLFDADTGKYGGGDEKKILKEFALPLREQVSKDVVRFLQGHDAKGDDVPGNPIGLITLQEISNTKATLFITELYLTCLLHYAKDNIGACPKILIVVEEAHTVMPEPNTMGLGDFDSKGLVGKIAQVALQGRKYGVGLLVVTQRTATVSKTVLTQCNTMISFSCFDETSLGYLSNIFSARHIKLIPNLPRLHAVIFGKALRSEQPVVVEIPYDPVKAARGM